MTIGAFILAASSIFWFYKGKREGVREAISTVTALSMEQDKYREDNDGEVSEETQEELTQYIQSALKD